MNEHEESRDLPTASHAADSDSRLEEIILQYFKAVDAGRPPDRRQLIDQYSDLADELRAFFSEQDAANAALGPPPSTPLPAQVGRCQLLGELGRGGMGAVFRGRDTDLNRDVAIKVLLETHQGKSELARRFVEEARIAGQLQHPGVTPVYELGAFPDRRPYFTMKLVKGQTLAALLAARPEPAAELTRFVGVFAQVCQALAYAHARGVIHRDLKPANVMVGAFGEVQVMDWGLAKVLKPEAAEEVTAEEPGTLIQTGREAGADTGAGSVLGTPAYMAPEQARGEVATLDERCDVFGLGAILCVVLTGQPPYTDPSGREVYSKARAADTAEALARLDVCGADAELIALARRCLAAAPADRPRNAGEVAAAVTAYQESVAERLRQAELQRAAAEARAEEEKKTRQMAEARRRAQLGMAAAVLLLVLLGGSAAAWYWQQRSLLIWDVEAALAEAATNRNAGQWTKAKAALEKASGRLAVGGPLDLQQRLKEAHAEMEFVADVEEIRLRQAAVDVRKNRFTSEQALPDYAAAFRAYGLTPEVSDPAEIATQVRQRPLAIRDTLVSALEDWTALAEQYAAPQRENLRQVLAAADPDPLRNRFRAARAARDRSTLEALAQEFDVAQQPRLTSYHLGQALGDLKSHEAAAKILLQAYERYPDDFWIHERLGAELQAIGRLGEAIRFLTAAVALRPSSPGAHYNLGLALAKQGDHEGAFAAHRRAIALDQNYATAHNSLGLALYNKGNMDEAISEYRTAIKLNPKDAIPHYNLGQALRKKRQLKEAIRQCQAAIELDSTNAELYTGFGMALRDMDRLDEAIEAYRTAIELDPNDAKPHNNLGNALFAKGRVDEAVREHWLAVKLDPRSAVIRNNLGSTLRKAKRLDDAIQEYRTAIRLDPKYAEPHQNLGNARMDRMQWGEAAHAFRAAIALDSKNVDAHLNLGSALYYQNKLDEAIVSYRAAIALAPKYAQAHFNLGLVLRSRGDFSEAFGALWLGHELGSRQKGWGLPSAKLLEELKPLAELDRKTAAILNGEAKPKNPSELLRLGRFCLTQKKAPAAAARLYADAFQAEPELADDLDAGDRFTAARAAALAGVGKARDAAELDEPGRAHWRQQALVWLRADLNAWAKRLKDADPDGRAEVRTALQRWQSDRDLAGLRDAAALERLPADERTAWRGFWKDVSALAEKARP